jgi:hypothetical protein
VTISPRLLRAGLVEVDRSTLQIRNVIALQYNPDTLSRTVQLQSTGADGGNRSEALRLRGAAVETISFDAEIDATDALEDPDGNPTAAEVGIHPQLAALEALAHPRVAALTENDALAAAGMLEILPLESPLTVFVWSKQRVVPVRLTELRITEEAFDTSLNPIRAKVSIGVRVLSVDDLGFDHPGGRVFLAHLSTKEALARRVAATTPTPLGIEGVEA